MADGDISLYSDHIKLDSTLPLTLAQALDPAKHSMVQGSYFVDRDLCLDTSILDPDGNAEFRREMRYGTYVEVRVCQSPLHRGLRRVPAVEFDGNDDVCRSCRGEAEHQRRVANAKPMKAKYWKRMHVRGGK